MKPSDWKYETEGGKHVIFSYHSANGDSDNPHVTSGSLLRLDKRKLVGAATTYSETQNDPELAFVVNDSKECVDDYARRFIYPKLAKYLDLPRDIIINAAFARGLVHLSKDKIAEQRRTDWKERDPALSDAERQVAGQILPDYRLWNSMRSSDAQTVTFEIKPKAGYLATSPLVHPTRRIKYQASRFQILQALAERKLVSKNWFDSKQTFQRSSYDPLDLFSGNKERIAVAIRGLLGNPQNNLSMWTCLDPSLGGNGCENPACVDWLGVVKVLGVESRGMQRSDALAFVTDLLAAVLQRECCLSSILELQKLDVLDGDGAILVFERLVQLCGSSDKAVVLLDSSFDHETQLSTAFAGQRPIHISPVVMRTGSKSENVTAFLEKATSFVRLLEHNRPSLPSTSEMDTAHSEAVSIARRFSLDECVYLLQNWLLSLTMCDISIFLTFTSSALNEESYLSKKVLLPRADSSEVIHSANSTTHGVRYRIRLVDYDQKPAKKLKTRLLKEVPIDYLRDDNP